MLIFMNELMNDNEMRSTERDFQILVKLHYIFDKIFHQGR